MRAVRISRVGRREGLDRLQLLRLRAGQFRDFLIGNRAIRAGDADMAVGDFQIADRRFELVGGQFLQRGDERLRRARHHHRADRNRARAAGAIAGRHAIGVALHDLDAIERHVEILRDDLRISGLVALAVGLGADIGSEIAVRAEFDRAFLALAPGGAFDIAGKADAADEAALLRRFGARAEPGIIGLGEGGAHRALEIADIIGARRSA